MSKPSEKSDEERGERIATLKRKIAATKKILKQTAANPEVDPCGPGRGNPNIVEIGKATQFKKGDNKIHGPTITKKRIRFWRYVVEFLEMNRMEVEALDEDDLTCAESGARRFALAVADGQWLHMKEVIERELGRVKDEGQGSDDDDRPKLIKLPFKISQDAV